jgi:hypothetical protein
MAATEGDDELMAGPPCWPGPGEDHGWTARVRLAVDSFVVPARIRDTRTPDVQKKYALIKVCEDPAICPVEFERLDEGLFLKRRVIDGRYSIPGTFGCTQHLIYKIGLDEVKIFSVCDTNGRHKETRCDGCLGEAH